MIKNGRTFREDIKLIIYGIKEFSTFLPNQMIYLIIHSIIISLIPYISIYVVAQIINELTSGKDIQKLIIYVIIAISLTLILTIVAAYLQKKITIGYNQLFSAHEIRLNEKANKLPYALLEDEKVRELRDQVSGSIGCSGAGMGSLYWDIETLSKSLCSIVIAIVLCASVFLNGINQKGKGIFYFVNSYYSILVLLVLILISAVVSSKMTSKVFDVMFDVFKRGANYNRYANFYKLEYLSDNNSAKDVRIFAQKELIINETQNRCYIPFCIGDKREKNASTKYNGIKLVLSSITGGVVYLLIGLKALSGVLGIGSVIMAYSAVTKLIYSLSDFFMTVTDLRNNNEHLIKYFEYIELCEIDNINKEKLTKNKKYNISFESVKFIYPRSEQEVLKNINISIRHGDKVAIVGENGSGKTTLIKLLCGLYDVTGGSISINDKIINSVEFETYSDIFSVVFQDFKLLALSIGQNVSISNKYDEERVNTALKEVGLFDKISLLSNGIEEKIYQDFDKNGLNLSGGEEQKLAIARALYKEAPIIILDEPTAALDPASEYEIYTKLRNMAKGKTTLFISHRLYSCRFCDRIIVMDKGEIVQIGTHNELVNVDGKYADLWNVQAQHYK
ncbi:MAG: ABC transporter ATP-binding protein [Clostridiales bacterium]